MSSSSDKRKVISQVHVKEEVYNWIVKKANSVGDEIRFHVGDMLELWYIAREEVEAGMQENPETLVALKHNAIRKKTEMRTKVHRIASMYIQMPNEANADILKDACDAAGMHYDEVIGAAEQDPFSSIISQAYGKTKQDEAILWLTQKFNEVSTIPSTIVYQEGEKQGFSEKTLQRARNYISMDDHSPTIRSVRKPDQWVWTILEEGEEEKYMPPPSASPSQRPQAVYFIDPLEEPIQISISEYSDDEISRIETASKKMQDQFKKR
jgi:hypothetical protein